jgi:protein-S-isoprenylcysteine O-methyltransferase Ste14
VAAMRVLGRLYTSTLGIQHEHRLVTTGPYKYIRHPGYLGEVMSMFSVGLSLSSIVGLILGVASLVLVLVRIKPEEEMLIEHFGKEYQSYMRKTKRLIPFIY